MQITHPIDFLKLLGHDLRWQLVSSLRLSDLRVQELVDIVQQPMNLVSYHLKKLRVYDLVSVRKSEFDGRDMYYSLDLERLYTLYNAMGQALHPRFGMNSKVVRKFDQLTHKRVLFVCTHNSARSQMAEGLLSYHSQGQVEAISAGSHPSEIHPDAITVMDMLGIDIRSQQSKALDTVSENAFDYVFTVCDRAREVCPVLPVNGAQHHWGFPDPTMIKNDDERLATFRATAEHLQSRILYFLDGIQNNIY